MSGIDRDQAIKVELGRSITQRLSRCRCMSPDEVNNDVVILMGLDVGTLRKWEKFLTSNKLILDKIQMEEYPTRQKNFIEYVKFIKSIPPK